MIRCGMLAPNERGFLFWEAEDGQYLKLPAMCKQCRYREGKSAEYKDGIFRYRNY